MKGTGAQLPEIEGVEQLETPIDGSQPFTRVFYSDKAEELIATVTALPDRARHFIAPLVGWPKRIYRKPNDK